MSTWRHLSDQEIVAVCLNGEKQAYGVLVERYQQTVFNVVYRLLGNYAMCEEVCQEAFVNAYEKLAQFSGRSKFSTWLCQIALNRGRDVLRRRGAQDIHDDLDDYGDVLAAAETTNPQRQVEDKQTQQRVRHLLATLPQQYRELLVLKHIEGYSNEDIARILGITVENAKIRAFRARKMFRQACEEGMS